MSTKNIHEFDDLLAELGIEVSTLGCVMLPVEPFDLFADGRDALLDVEDLYASNDPKKWWVQGDVTYKAHITLLYGLMKPAYEQKDAVDRVLEGWERPEYLVPLQITIFPSPDDEEYAAIVAEVGGSALTEAHQRLSYLPHVDTFPVYKPHMTLAYVRLEAAQRWRGILQDAQFHIYVKGDELDYGSEK